MTNLNDFVHAIAVAINDSPDIVLADDDAPVFIVWAVGNEPDTIVVNDIDGDVYRVSVQKMSVDA